MPLLLPFSSLYSASILKLLNLSLDTMLAAGVVGYALVIVLSSVIDQGFADGGTYAQASSDEPSNNMTGFPYVWLPFALDAGHVGGRTPTQFTTRVVGGGGGGAFGSG